MTRNNVHAEKLVTPNSALLNLNVFYKTLMQQEELNKSIQQNNGYLTQSKTFEIKPENIPPTPPMLRLNGIQVPLRSTHTHWKET